MGMAPNAQVVEKEWAHSFILGLVPPETVETAKKCPNGVAKVETQQSFLNGFVAFLTSYIYTPMTIKVTCGTGKVASLPVVKSDGDLAATMSKAADIAVATGAPVLVVTR
jgi:hypothetical protein